MNNSRLGGDCDVDTDDEDEEDEREVKSADVEFILGELLRIALHLDYTDEIGRRKMFGIIRKPSHLV